MIFQANLKMIIDFTVHQTTENYDQTKGSHVLKREYTAWC